MGMLMFLAWPESAVASSARGEKAAASQKPEAGAPLDTQAPRALRRRSRSDTNAASGSDVGYTAGAQDEGTRSTRTSWARAAWAADQGAAPDPANPAASQRVLRLPRTTASRRVNAATSDTWSDRHAAMAPVDEPSGAGLPLVGVAEPVAWGDAATGVAAAAADGGRSGASVDGSKANKRDARAAARWYGGEL